MTEMIIGFGVGVLLLSVLMFIAIQRTRQQSADRLTRQEETIADLRLELAEDKENNRLLRHQLHSLSSASAGRATGSGGELAIEAFDEQIIRLTNERDQARLDLSASQMSLEATMARLEDRETKLNEYREAVKEIRLSLEGQDNLSDIIAVTGDLPAKAQAGE